MARYTTHTISLNDQEEQLLQHILKTQKHTKIKQIFKTGMETHSLKS